MTDIKRWLKGELESNYYSPDMPDLYAKDEHYLFVYGLLKAGEFREDVLEDEIFVAEAYTKYASYGIMECRSAHGMVSPFAYGETRYGQGSLLKGELYYVTTDKLIECDYIFSNNIQTKRVSLPIVTADRHLQAMAWVYFIHPNFESDMRAKSRITNYNKRYFLWNTPTAEWSHQSQAKAA